MRFSFIVCGGGPSASSTARCAVTTLPLLLSMLLLTSLVPIADSFSLLSAIHRNNRHHYHQDVSFSHTCTTGTGRSATFKAIHYVHVPASRCTSALQMSVPNSLDTLTSGLASIARLPFGVTVSDTAKRLQLEDGDDDFTLSTLYDIENDRECRRVRERISELDLIVQAVVPAASNSRVFVDPSYEYALPEGSEIPRLVAKKGGSSGEEMVYVGSEDILSYLDATYAVDGSSGSSAAAAAATSADGDIKQQIIDAALQVGSYLPGILRAGRGASVCPAASASSSVPVPRPTKPLILYSYEGNQFCRLVREVLTELDLPYELRSAGKGSPRRAEMAEMTGGSSQCPYLIDDNTGTAMFESADIIRYLYKTYALWTPPAELLESASAAVTPLLKPVYKVLAPLQAGSNREDKREYEAEIAKATAEIEQETNANAVVVYVYELSPFCTEATDLLDNLAVSYKKISLGKEWIPGLIQDPLKRAALGEMTGQTSLPHVFVGGKSIGGIFSGTPGLVPALEEGNLMNLIEEAK